MSVCEHRSFRPDCSHKPIDLVSGVEQCWCDAQHGAGCQPSLGNNQHAMTFDKPLLSSLRLSAGAQNVFDVYPDENIASTVASVAAGTNGADNAGTQPYNAIAPYGFNGRSVFVRAGFNF